MPTYRKGTRQWAEQRMRDNSPQAPRRHPDLLEGGTRSRRAGVVAVTIEQTLKDWMESTTKQLQDATEQMRLMKHEDQFSYEHFRDEVQYLNGRLDAYKDARMLFTEERLGIL